MPRPSKSRLATPKRREGILKSAQAVFAERGFDGATTKELARAAGISEALLFRHFPSKFALYAAVQACSCDSEAKGPMHRIAALEPSTASLVALIYHFYCHMALSPRHADAPAGQSMPKLILQSLAGDGEFARHCHAKMVSRLVQKMSECLEAAAEAGDLLELPGKMELRCWFVQHLAAMLAFNSLHQPPIVDYGLPRRKLAEQAVFFALRGLGLKEEAIRRHYNPSALALLAG